MTTEPGSLQLISSASGRYLAGHRVSRTEIWALDSPPAAEAQVLRGGEGTQYALWFDPRDEWYVATTPILGDRVTLVMWPLTRPLPAALRRHTGEITALRFTPDGRSLLSSSSDGELFRWDLDPTAGSPGVRTLLKEPWGQGMVADARCEKILRLGPTIRLLTLDGAPPRSFPGREVGMWSLAISPKGKTGLIGGGFLKQSPGLKVLDLETGEMGVIDPGDEDLFLDLVFLSEDRFISSGECGLRSWSLSTGSSELLLAGKFGSIALGPSGRALLVIDGRNVATYLGAFLAGSTVIYDLETRSERPLPSHGQEVTAVAFHPGGQIVVTGNRAGEIRVGPASGEVPHLLLSDDAAITAVAVSPDGRWIASGDMNGVIRLWPTPSGRPIQGLSFEEFRRELRRLTNLRIVADGSAENGYRLDVDPFENWAVAPTW
jgi:WD40 repeat protein